jgi:hypothetical protein
MAAENPRPSLRWDVAQRACRDGDLKTLRWLFENADLFEDKDALREACISGAWATGNDELLKRPFSTTDSIRLHTMLQAATTRCHVGVVHYILEQFPAKDLHVLEWEVIVNAIGQASVPLLEEFVNVDPSYVNLYRSTTGNCFQVLFSVVAERELHLPIVKFLLAHGADPSQGREDAVQLSCLESAVAFSTPAVVELLETHHIDGDKLLMLGLAASAGNVEMCRYLVDQGADIDLVGNGLGDRGTPIELATRQDHADVVSFLENSRKRKS